MQYQQARGYLLNKPEASESYPFGPDVAVYKVSQKMFATLSHHDGMPCMNLKCDPDEAFALRDVFDAVKPGYHMNKKHWNTLMLDLSIPPAEIERQIDNSYQLVVNGLKKIERQRLSTLYGLPGPST